MPTEVQKAEAVARKWHEGQTDKQGMSYIEHPAFVADHLYSDIEKATAWLHDVIEDTDLTISDLKNMGFSKEVITAVALLTKENEQDYEAYIVTIKENPVARKVKIEDIKHNLLKAKTLDIGKTEKYESALNILME